MTCGDTRRRRWWVHPILGGFGRPPMEGSKVDKYSTDFSITPLSNPRPTCQWGVSRPPYWSAQGQIHSIDFMHA